MSIVDSICITKKQTPELPRDKAEREFDLWWEDQKEVGLRDAQMAFRAWMAARGFRV